MQRHTITPRHDWRQKLEAIGFVFHTVDGVYWNEAACYTLDMDEVDNIETATAELHALCEQAVDHVVRQDRFGELAIAEPLRPWIRRSWERRDASLYGRLDLSYGESGSIKLLEYNADTPTALFEASVAQWYWLQDHDRDRDQFNSIHEKLIDRWRALREHMPASGTVHFACLHDNVEDFITTEYLRDTAVQAGFATVALDMADIGFDSSKCVFVDTNHSLIGALFKLYPWEWMVAEEFGGYLESCAWRVMEPPWKMILSNKGILAILWELFPDHPHLLPAYFDSEPLRDRYCRKPLLSREGANVVLRDGDSLIESGGDYGQEGFVYQALSPLPVFDGSHAVIGSWIIGDQPAGIGIREDDDPITRNTSRFVPHFIT